MKTPSREMRLSLIDHLIGWISLNFNNLQHNYCQNRSFALINHRYNSLLGGSYNYTNISGCYEPSKSDLSVFLSTISRTPTILPPPPPSTLNKNSFNTFAADHSHYSRLITSSAAVPPLPLPPLPPPAPPPVVDPLLSFDFCRKIV